MLLKNFFACLDAIIRRSYSSVAVKSIENGNVDPSNIDSKEPFYDILSNDGTKYVKCGTGTTPPTINDYALQTLDSNLSVSNISVGITKSDNSVMFSLSFTVTNTSSITKSLSEFCYGKSKNSDYWSHLTYIGIREVLSTPIELAAGASTVLSYSINIA